jgi:chromosome segregation ATPase
MAMAASANGEIFKWTDSKGGEHFTDNSDKIPAKYRNKAREMDVTPVIQETEQPSKSELKSNAPAAQNLIGGHDEKWWRSRYKALRDEMKGIQDNLPEKRDRLNELRRQLYTFSKPSGRIAYNDMYAEIGKDEARITDLQKKLQDLDTSAAKSGVPLEWRQ